MNISSLAAFFSRISLGAFIRWTVVVLGVFFVFQVFSVVYAAIAGMRLTDAVFLFAGGVPRDAEERTNIVLLGVGGDEHDGGSLTDTVLIASYHHEQHALSMLSLPRDLWVRAGDGRGMRLNAIYEYEQRRLGSSEHSLARMAETAGRIAHLDIHFYAKIDFDGFVDIVDALGGVEILVPYSIDDPYYPCPGLQGYCPFTLSAGVRQLDGDLALKFARSRKTTSDFSRAERQQLLIAALREQALSRDVLGNPKKIKEIMAIIDDRFETNMSLREMIATARIARDMDRERMNTAVLSDDPRSPGGLLIPPPRADYGGAAVMIPARGVDDYTDIHLFSRVLFSEPALFFERPSIEVLNASGTPRIAERVAYHLHRFGFYAPRINNYPDRAEFPTTTIQLHSEEFAAGLRVADVLPDFMPIAATRAPSDPALAARGFDLTLVIGQDARLDDF